MNGPFGSGPGPAGSASVSLPHGNNAVATIPGNENGTLDPAVASRVSKTHRPQVYVHLEFGLSWSQGHLPNSHAVTYQSRALRDQLTSNGQLLPPPQLPPPQVAQTQTPAAPVPFIPLHWDATHSVYLKPRRLPVPATTTQQRPVTHRHSSADLAHNRRSVQPTHRHSSIEPAWPTQCRQPPAQSLWERHTASNLQPQQEHPRQIARDPRSERGRSEPPPANHSLWAAAPFHSAAHPSGLGSAPLGVMPQSATRHNRAIAGPSTWKPLPAIPARFRQEPGAVPDHERVLQSTVAASAPAIVLHVPETTPIVVPIQSPLPDAPRYREIDPKRRNDLQVLSEAMMWNRGPEAPPSPPSPPAVPGTTAHAPTPFGAAASHNNAVHHSSAYSESNYDGFEEEALSEPGSPAATAWPRRSSAPLLGPPRRNTSATVPSASKAPLPPLSCAAATTKGAHAPSRAPSAVSAVSAASAVSTVSAVSADPSEPAYEQQRHVVSPLSATATMVSPETDAASQPALLSRRSRSTSEGSIRPWSPAGTVHSSGRQPHPLVRADELFFDL